jgi:CYTH domain-containing protein
MGSHGYARIEHERRFLLDAPPPGLSDAHVRITDLYLDGLRLRLRAMVPSDGRPAEYKLGQKFRREGMEVDQREMTTMYLTRSEYDALAARLGPLAHVLEKRRYRYEHGGWTWGIDVFAGAIAGLVLAELEMTDAAALRAVAIPGFAVREVTGDPAYEGGSLARVSAGRIAPRG